MKTNNPVAQIPMASSISVPGRDVFIDFVEDIGNETGDNQTHPFFDVDTDKDQDTAKHQECVVAAVSGIRKIMKGRDVEEHCGPDPGHKRVVTVQALEQVLIGARWTEAV